VTPAERFVTLLVRFWKKLTLGGCNFGKILVQVIEVRFLPSLSHPMYFPYEFLVEISLMTPVNVEIHYHGLRISLPPLLYLLSVLAVSRLLPPSQQIPYPCSQTRTRSIHTFAQAAKNNVFETGFCLRYAQRNVVELPGTELKVGKSLCYGMSG
jgi:hypothetical protein